MRIRAALLVGGLALAPIGVAGPAEAAGGPPSITSVTPDPVGPGGILTVAGTGCAAGSPISFYVWQTAGGGYGYWHSTNTAYVADGTGAFSKALGFAAPFVPDPGSEIGVAASCTSTYDPSQASNPMADDSYVLVSLPDPTVSVAVPARVGYGAPVRVTVTPTRAAGTVVLRLDGATVHTTGSAWGAYTVTLPGAPAVGAHALEAVFDPTVAGAPTVTGSATFTVTRASATVSLTAAKAKVKKGKKVMVTVRLTSTGPIVGRVRIKDGSKVRRTVTLTAADAGAKRVKVRLPKAGKRKLTAVFDGNAQVAPGRSGKVRVKVTR